MSQLSPQAFRKLNSKRTCHWCGVLIYRLSQYKIKRGWKVGDIYPDNMMTKDHLLPKAHPYRKQTKMAFVYACQKCNAARGDKSIRWLAGVNAT